MIREPTGCFCCRAHWGSCIPCMNWPSLSGGVITDRVQFWLVTLTHHAEAQEVQPRHSWCFTSPMRCPKRLITLPPPISTSVERSLEKPKWSEQWTCSFGVSKVKWTWTMFISSLKVKWTCAQGNIHVSERVQWTVHFGVKFFTWGGPVKSQN